MEVLPRRRPAVSLVLDSSAATRQALGDAFRFELRGALEVKGKGSLETYLLYRAR